MKRLIYFLKILITLVLIYFLFSKVNLSLLINEILKVKPLYFLIALIAMLGAWIANTFRWKMLLDAFDKKISIFRLFIYNMASIFYTTVLPGGKIAGDTVRAYQVARDHDGDMKNKSKMFFLVFIDRGIGLLGLALFACIYFIFGHQGRVILGSNFGIVVGVIVGVTIIGLLLVFLNIIDWMLKFLAKSRFAVVTKLSNLVLDCLVIIRNSKSGAIRSLFFSLLSVVVSGFAVYMVGLGLGVNISFWTITFINSLAVLLIVVPITLGGVGLREGALVYLLQYGGVDIEKAVALSLLNLLMLLIFAAIGGLTEFHYHFLDKSKNGNQVML